MEKNKIAAINCKTEYMVNPVGIDSRTQLLQWQCTVCVKQSAYQIMLYRNGELLCDTGKVLSDSMQYLVPGAASLERPRGVEDPPVG